MALIKCTKCGHMISDKAKVCPKCGITLEIEKIYKNVGQSKWLWQVVLAIIVLFGVLFCVIKGDMFADKGEKELIADQNKGESQVTEEGETNISRHLSPLKFSDVFVLLSTGDITHINKNLFDLLKERGYSVLKDETTSEYHEAYCDTIEIRDVYLSVNMDYKVTKTDVIYGIEEIVDWKKTGSPCSGVRITMSPDNDYVLIAFESEEELDDFVKDAKNAGFSSYGDSNSWSRNSDYPSDCIYKVNATTLSCSSSMPF